METCQFLYTSRKVVNKIRRSSAAVSVTVCSSGRTDVRLSHADADSVRPVQGASSGTGIGNATCIPVPRLYCGREEKRHA